MTAQKPYIVMVRKCLISGRANASREPGQKQCLWALRFQLDNVKIRRAQKALQAKTETETIERALDAVIAEDKHNQLVTEANERFVKSGIEIQDVYGALE